jgi:2-polyprenyl-3-methyl-5-hydroxy-6-metoxy-1,4-benzoquinol methylase
MALLSEYYRGQLRALHEGKWGDEGHTWAGAIAVFASYIGAATVLDYGCGKGTLAPALRERPRFFSGRSVAEYDPAIPGKEALPGPADLVVTTDVLEHVEPESLNAVLTHIRGLSNKGVFHVISCRHAAAKLADGRNAHLIVESPQWWVKKLAAYWPRFEAEGGARELIFKGRP